MDKGLLILLDRRGYECWLLQKGQEPGEHQGLRFRYRNGWYLNLPEGCTLSGRKTLQLQEGVYTLERENRYYLQKLYVYADPQGFDEWRILPRQDLRLSSKKEAALYRPDLPEGEELILEGDRIRGSALIYRNGRAYMGESLQDHDEIFFYGQRLFLAPAFLLINTLHTSFRIDACKPRCDRFYLFWQTRQEVLQRRYKPCPEPEVPTVPEKRKIAQKAPDSLLRQIGPSLTMSSALLAVSGINMAQAIQNGRRWQETAVLGIFPLTMFLSGLCWPLILRRSEKKQQRKNEEEAQKEFSLAKEDYACRWQEKLQARKEARVQRAFRPEESEELLKEGRIFTRQGELYLTLGEYREEGEIPFPEIRRQTAQEMPLLWQPQGLCGLYENPKDRDLFLNRLFAELVLNYRPEDLLIAVYDPEGRCAQEWKYIAHLYAAEKRWILQEEKELKELAGIRERKILLFSFAAHRQTIPEGVAEIRCVRRREELPPDAVSLICADNGKGELEAEEKTVFRYSRLMPDLARLSRSLLCYRIPEHPAPLAEISFAQLLGAPIEEADLCRIRSRKGLRADFAFADGKVMPFDLHESAQGPHGLIGGTTGSGKSQLLLSLLLSAALHHPPSRLEMVLIDYKGTGLSDALSYQGKLIPQVIAAYSDLQKENCRRFLAALRRECEEREELFSRLSLRTQEAILSLDDYRSQEPQRFSLPQKAHLLIVVDEFAQLKQEEPQFLQELLRIARIGRSLGLHLLLATQKPGSCVNEEIRANTRYRIALKTADPQDSQELIGSAEAASLRWPGEFYICTDGECRYGRAIYAQSQGNTRKVTLYDARMRVLSSTLLSEGKAEKESQKICRKILETDGSERRSFAPPPPQPATAAELAEKYGIDCRKELILGEIDDFENGRREAAVHTWAEAFSFLVVGKDPTAVLNGCYRAGLPVTWIGGEISHPAAADVIAVDDQERLQRLWTKITISDNERDRCLLVADLGLLSALSAESDRLLRTFRCALSKKFRIIAFVRSPCDIPYRLLSFFRFRCTQRTLDSEEQRLLFEKEGGDTPLWKEGEELFLFVPLQEERMKGDCRLPAYLPPIPEKIALRRKEGKILLGYRQDSGEAFYAREGLISAEKEEYLQYYAPCRNYGFRVEKTPVETGSEKALLWVGPGLYRQRLFSVRQQRDLQEGEALWKEKNTEILLYAVNSALRSG
ncbi:MAG: hypothetical protein IKE21_05760 [Erysipelotrichaceae bacterium]|nr:hypothetical protein [Erysipelotrichaceae bacterium]